MSSRALSLAAGLAVMTWNCGTGPDFDAKSVLEANPVRLDGEQVTLSSNNVTCGVNEELWERPSQVSDGRSVARLTPKGRALNLSDDVTLEANSQPYVQVRGDFPIQVDEVTDVGAIENDTRVVTAKAGIRIQHACFPNPKPLMGVKHGNFQADTPVSFLLRQTKDGWKVEKLIH